MTFVDLVQGNNPRNRFANNQVSVFEDEDTSTFLSLNEIQTNASLIRQVAPYLGGQDNPSLAIDLASSGLDPVELARSTAAIQGMISSEKLAGQLRYMPANDQRSYFNSLTWTQQTSLRAIGYEPPAAEQPHVLVRGLGKVGSAIGGSGLGQAVAFVGKPVIQGLDFVSETFVQRPYRTIKQLDSWTQTAALAAGLVGGVAALALAPFTMGASVATYGGVMTSLGVAGLVGLTAATTTAAAIETVKAIGDNENQFAIAWSQAGDGEKLFTRDAQQYARELLMMPGLDQIARDIAVDLDPYTIAEFLAGTANSDNPNVRIEQAYKFVDQYADEGTPEWEAIANNIAKLLDDQMFVSALNVLQNGKISFGRDLARGLRLEPGSRGYNIVSGAGDAAWRLWVDPINIAGPAVRFSRMERYALFEADSARGFFRQGKGIVKSFDPDRLVRLADENTKVRESFQGFANAVRTGRYTDVVPNLRSAWTPFHNWARQNKLINASGQISDELDYTHIVKFFTDGDGGLELMMQGVGLRRGYNGLHVLNPQSNLSGLGALRRTLLDVRDVMTEQARLKNVVRLAEEQGLDATMLDPDWADGILLDGLVKEIPARQITDPLIQRVGRQLTYIDRATGNTLGKVIDRLTRLSSRGVIDLNSGQGIDRAIESAAAVFGYPQHITDKWINLAMTQSSAAARGRVIQSFYDTLFNVTGMRATEEGARMADEYLDLVGHSYGVGGTDQVSRVGSDVTKSIPRGLLPGDQADFVAIPDVRRMIKASRDNIYYSTIGKVTKDGEHTEQVMKWWRPAVLLRAGFVTRNTFEELLSWFARGTEGEIVAEFGARNLAKYDAYIDAKNTAPALRTKAQEQALNWEHTTSGKAVSRLAGAVGGEGPVEHLVLRYENWLRDIIRFGVSGTKNPNAARKFGAALDNIGNPMVQNILRGRQNSWRAIGLRGIDPTLKKSADSWMRRHGAAIMKGVGADQSSVYADLLSQPAEVAAVAMDEGRTVEVPAFVKVNENQRYSTGDPHFAWAQHNDMAHIINDPVLGPMLEEQLPRIMSTHPDFDWFTLDILTEYATTIRDPEVAHIFSLLAYGDPQMLHFKAVELRDRALRLRQGAQESTLATPPRLAKGQVDTAKAINESMEARAYELLADMLDEFNQNALNNVTDVQSLRNKLGFIVSLPFARQSTTTLNSFKELDDFMSTLLPDLIELRNNNRNLFAFYNLALNIEQKHALTRGTRFYNKQQFRALATGQDLGDVNAPRHVVYRGIPATNDRNSYEILPDGSLRLTLHYQDNFGDGYAVLSTAIDPQQAMGYAFPSNLGAGIGLTSSGFPQGVVFELDFDQVANSFGTRTSFESVANGKPLTYDVFRPAVKPAIGEQGYGVPQLLHNPYMEPSEIAFWADESDLSEIILPPGSWRTIETGEFNIQSGFDEIPPQELLDDPDRVEELNEWYRARTSYGNSSINNLAHEVQLRALTMEMGVKNDLTGEVSEFAPETQEALSLYYNIVTGELNKFLQRMDQSLATNTDYVSKARNWFVDDARKPSWLTISEQDRNFAESIGRSIRDALGLTSDNFRTFFVDHPLVVEASEHILRSLEIGFGDNAWALFTERISNALPDLQFAIRKEVERVTLQSPFAYSDLQDITSLLERPSVAVDGIFAIDQDQNILGAIINDPVVKKWIMSGQREYDVENFASMESLVSTLLAGDEQEFVRAVNVVIDDLMEVDEMDNAAVNWFRYYTTDKNETMRRQRFLNTPMWKYDDEFTNPVRLLADLLYNQRRVQHSAQQMANIRQTAGTYNDWNVLRTLVNDRGLGEVEPMGRRIYLSLDEAEEAEFGMARWGEFMKSKNAHLVSQSDRTIRPTPTKVVKQNHVPSSRHVFAVPLTNPNRVAVAFSEVMAGAGQSLSRDEVVRLVADRLFTSNMARKAQGNLLSGATNDELYDSLVKVLDTLYEPAGVGRLVNAPPTFIPTIGFDDPRVASWLRDVLSGINYDDVQEGRQMLYQTVLPLWRGSTGEDEMADGIKILNVSQSKNTGNRFTFEMPVSEFQPVEGNVLDQVVLLDGTVTYQYGTSYSDAVREWTETLGQHLSNSLNTRSREVFRPNNPANIYLDPLEAGELRKVADENSVFARNTKLYDEEGNELDVTDFNYFTPETNTEPGDLKWALIAPMIIDNIDDRLGRKVLVAKDAASAPAGQILEGGDFTRLTRSNATDANYVDTEEFHTVVAPKVLLNTEELKKGVFQKIVDKTFGGVFSPMIDAISRTPMAFHEYSTMLPQNLRFVSGFIDDNAIDVARKISFADGLDQAIDILSEPYKAFGADEQFVFVLNEVFDGVPDYILRRVEEGNMSIPDFVRYVQKMDPSGNPNVDALRKGLRIAGMDGAEPVITAGQVVKAGDIPEDVPEVGTTLLAVRSFVDLAETTAATRAINEVSQYIDSSEVRSVASLYVQNLLPFWYAEENFVRRWVKTIAATGDLGLREIHRGALLYGGLKEAGFLQEDMNGDTWFVYPGSGLLNEAMFNVFNLFGGNAPNYGVMNRARADQLLPGFNGQALRPGVGPMGAVPIKLLTQMFPELHGFERSVLGDVSANRNVIEQFIPTTLTRGVQTLYGLFGNAETQLNSYGSQMRNAFAFGYASGDVPAETATAAEWDDYYDRLRNSARISLVTNWILGTFGFVPGSPSTVLTGDEGNLNVSDMFKENYRNYLRLYGFEEGVRRFLADNPFADVTDIVNPLAFTVPQTETVTSGPLPATATADLWYTNNADLANEYPNGMSWFVPDQGYDPNNVSSSYAFGRQFTNELRKRRSPREFIDAVIYRIDAQQYFELIDERDARLKAVKGNEAAHERLKFEYEEQIDYFLTTHPLFARMLSENGAEQRQNTIDQIRILRNLPDIDSPYQQQIKYLADEWDKYYTLRKQMSQNGSAQSRYMIDALDVAWHQIGDAWAIMNPEISMLWVSIYKPESGQPS